MASVRPGGSIIVGMSSRTVGVVGLLVLLVLLGSGLSACSPALNWRDVQPGDGGASALFPCKPDVHVRRVTLAGTERTMQLASCTAADSVYALSQVDVGLPDRVAPVLQALQVIAADNIGGAPVLLGPQRVNGMTPHPLAQRWAIAGRRADGSAIQAQAALFTKGTVVYQATVVGRQIDRDAADTFFSALKLP